MNLYVSIGIGSIAASRPCRHSSFFCTICAIPNQKHYMYLFGRKQLVVEVLLVSGFISTTKDTLRSSSLYCENIERYGNHYEFFFADGNRRASTMLIGVWATRIVSEALSVIGFAYRSSNTTFYYYNFDQIRCCLINIS